MLLFPGALLVISLLAAAWQRNWRVGFVVGFLGWATLALLFAEGSGLGRALKPGPCFAFWGIVAVIASGIAWRTHAWRRLPRLRAPRSLLGWLSLCTVVGLLGLALLRGLASAPNAPDVQNYHLPRQLMWMQQGSLEHFATPNDRMLMMPPLAEILQLQFMLLANAADTYAALPQWLAFFVGALLASLLAHDLRGGVAAQWLAAGFFVTVPMAYHQASSSKNDLLLAGLIMTAFYFALRLRRRPSRGFDWLALGLSAGLALLTKSSAALFLAPLIVLLWRPIWRQPRRAALALGLALLLPLPHATRNVHTYGTPLGHLSERDGAADVRDPWRPVAFMGNTLRHLALHAATPFPAVNQIIGEKLRGALLWAGLDPDDSSTTFYGTSFQLVWAPQVETRAGAPFLAIGLGVAGLILMLRRRSFSGTVVVTSCALLLSVLLIGLLLRWQPWGARLHLPIFGVGCAVVACVASRVTRTWLLPLALLGLVAWLPSSDTSARPLWHHPTVWETTREQDYFRETPFEAGVMADNLALIERSGIGSLYVDNVYDAPYFVMRRLRDDRSGHFHFWGDATEPAHSAPEGIWAFAGPQPLPFERQMVGATERYVAVGQTDPWVFYLPESRARSFHEPAQPNFGGFTSVTGLGEWEWVTSGASSLYVRRTLALVLKLGFSPSTTRRDLELSLFNRRVGCQLELTVNSRPAANLQIAASPRWQSIVLPLELDPAGGEISLRILPAAPGAESPAALTFARLRLREQD